MQQLKEVNISHSKLGAGRQRSALGQHCRVFAIICTALRTLSQGAEATSLRASSVSVEDTKDGIIGGGFADGFQSYLQNSALDNQIPPAAYWAVAGTPAPSLGPGPYPNLMWVEVSTTPLPATTPPVFEQCSGCYCMFVFPDGFSVNGEIADMYTCYGGAATQKVPHIKWAGTPGQDLTDKNGEPCGAKCSSFGLTIEDLDWPNGVGEMSNQVSSVFWAVNIPSNYTEINDQIAFAKDSKVVVGYNSQGAVGLENLCPGKGKHRYKVTLWSLQGYLGSEAEPFNAHSAFSVVKTALQGAELAKATFFATLAQH